MWASLLRRAGGLAACASRSVPAAAALPRALLERLEERLTYLQIAEVEAQRASWQALIEQDSSTTQLPVFADAPEPADAPATRDAAADAGIRSIQNN